ncbi:glycosyltransferase [uncultured Draconibacterium sp.]|uniref:glycosyltransferase n=1 Tax=uncultured Draconibacterium sp. TaxID=1573823 RepID=UPI003216ED61
MIQEFQNIFAQFTGIQLIVFAAFVVVYLIRLLYLFLFTGRVVFRKKSEKKTAVNTPVTLLFTLRNEETHIRKILPKILELEGFNFEVVVVDDYSQDSSYSVLGLLNQRYGRLKISSLNEETRFSVKLAQNIALKSASNNWVLITPISLSEVKEGWLSGILSGIESEPADVVCCYSSVVPAKGLFNLFYRIENFYQQIKNAAYINNGVPFIYNEDNIAFKKEKYFQIGGYGKNIKEQYANLELIVNAFITKKNTVVNFNSETAIRKNIEIKRAEYMDLLQKRLRIEKYLSTGKKLVLFTDALTNLLFLPLLALVLLLLFPLWPLIIILVGVKVVAQLLIIKITQNRLNERKIFIPSLVYGLLMPFYMLFYKWHFNRSNGKYK